MSSTSVAECSWTRERLTAIGTIGVPAAVLFNRSLENANEKLQYQAVHDDLTDLPNPHALTRYLQLAIESSTRNRRGFAVYFVANISDDDAME